MKLFHLHIYIDIRNGRFHRYLKYCPRGYEYDQHQKLMADVCRRGRVASWTVETAETPAGGRTGTLLKIIIEGS